MPGAPRLSGEGRNPRRGRGGVALSTSRPARWPAAGVLAVVAAVAGLLVLPATPWQDDTLAENLIALVAPVLAAGCAWWRWARSTGRHRRAWTALAAGITCWAV